MWVWRVQIQLGKGLPTMNYEDDSKKPAT